MEIESSSKNEYFILIVGQLSLLSIGTNEFGTSTNSYLI